MTFEPLPLNSETLTNLLNEGTERDGLDFKRACDLADSASKIELVKDIGAMLMYGGYIVVGADDQGRPSGELDAAQAKLFDQATLHDKAKRYLADGFEIRSTGIELDGDQYAIVCVLPHRDGLAPFRADGFYKDAKNRDTVAFRAGDIFTRRGTRSEPWAQDDVRHIRDVLRRQERESVRAEMEADFLSLHESSKRATTAAEAPADTLTWKLDCETLASAITEQLRRSDDIPLVALLKTAPREARAAIAADRHDEFEDVLDGLVSIAARLLVIERPQYARRAVDALLTIYNATFDASGYTRTDLSVNPATIQLAVITRVQALGALAVRERQWAFARYLADRPIAAHDADWWATWLFHGEVVASRAGLLRDPERRIGKSPLVIAQEHIARLIGLRPDVDTGDDIVMTSLCQFDILAAFAALNLPNGKRHGSFLAYFGQWFAQRSDPIVVELIQGGELRDVVFPRDDDALADAIRDVAYNASRMAQTLNGWDGWNAQLICDFLAQHTRAGG